MRESRTAAAAGEDIVLGFEHSPSPDPDPGEFRTRGAELAIEYVNTQMGGLLGGRKVRSEYEDHQDTAESAIASYRKLVTQKKAVAVFGLDDSGVTIAVNEVAKDLGVPVIATLASHKDVTAKGHPTAFRMHVIDPIRVAAWLQLMKEKGYRRIGIVADDTPTGVGLVEETQSRAPALGLRLELSAHIVDHTAKDFTPVLLEIRDFRPDLVLNLTADRLDLIIEQAIDLGLFPSIPMLLVDDQPASFKWWRQHPRSTGMMFISYFDLSRPLSEAGQWMRREYRARYGAEPPYSDLNPFGVGIVIAQAIELAKSTDPKKLIQALETGSFMGWSPHPVTFPRRPGVLWHNWSPPLQIHQLTEQGQDYTKAPVIVDYLRP